MVDPHISDREKRCVRIFANWFNEAAGERRRGPRELLKAEGLDLDWAEYEALMNVMQKLGLLKSVGHHIGDEGRFASFQIDASVVHVAREIDAIERQSQEPRDIVGQINEQVRKHKVLAWFIIVLVVVTALLTLISQVLQILTLLGWINAKA